MHELMRIDSPLAVKSSLDVINADRKNYEENSYRFALSQVEENNLELLHRRRDELLRDMNAILAKEGLDFIALLVTDPVRGNSELLITGSSPVIRALPFSKRKDGIFLLPGVLSREEAASSADSVDHRGDSADRIVTAKRIRRFSNNPEGDHEF